MAANGAAGAGGGQREIFTRLGPIAEGYAEFKNTVFNWFNPPLRTNDDLKAVIRGLQQDIIDRPWNAFERERSPPNLVGAPGRFGIINKNPQNDLWGPGGAGGGGGARPFQRNEIIVRLNHHPTIQGEWVSEPRARSYTGGSSRAAPAKYECPPPTVCHQWKLELHPNGELYAKYSTDQPAHNAFERLARGRFISFDKMEKILQRRNMGRLAYVMDHMNTSAHNAKGLELGLYAGALPRGQPSAPVEGPLREGEAEANRRFLPVGLPVEQAQGPQYLPEQSPIGATLAKFLGGQLPPLRGAGAVRSRRSKRKARKTQKNRHK